MPAFHAVRTWTKLHPIQTSFHVLNSLIVIEPSIVTAPILFVLGFDRDGPRRGTPASSTMKRLSSIEPSSAYAIIQSSAMGGYGAGPVAKATRAGALMSSAAMAYRAYRVWKRRGPR